MAPGVTSRIGIGFTGEGLGVREIIELGVAAERAGLDSAWHAENQRDPWVPLSVIASRTERIRIGTGIALWARSPVVMELAAANLDELSGGRFVLGLGTGPKERNERWYGIPYDAPVERLREWIELLRLMWTAHDGRTIDYPGPQLPVKGHRRALRPYRERIPIYAGGMRRKMLELAGELADGVILDSICTPRYVSERALPWLRAGLKRAGRERGDIEVAAMLIAAVDPDLERARKRARPQVAYYLGGSHADPIIRLHGWEEQAERLRAARAEGDIEGMVVAVDDAMLDEIALVGPADRCRAQLDRLDGIDLAILVPAAWRVEPGDVRKGAGAILEAFGR
ncbi:MAG TPA: LLM class flavin-dependent oxidoreductase [Chloroflexota bacterium]|nr:LLM class flavin-dependent oxidoreductase [Chloroflexota bacterium]